MEGRRQEKLLRLLWRGSSNLGSLPFLRLPRVAVACLTFVLDEMEKSSPKAPGGCPKRDLKLHQVLFVCASLVEKVGEEFDPVALIAQERSAAEALERSIDAAEVLNTPVVLDSLGAVLNAVVPSLERLALQPELIRTTIQELVTEVSRLEPILRMVQIPGGGTFVYVDVVTLLRDVNARTRFRPRGRGDCGQTVIEGGALFTTGYKGAVGSLRSPPRGVIEERLASTEPSAATVEVSRERQLETRSASQRSLGTPTRDELLDTENEAALARDRLQAQPGEVCSEGHIETPPRFSPQAPIPYKDGENVATVVIKSSSPSVEQEESEGVVVPVRRLESDATIDVDDQGHKETPRSAVHLSDVTQTSDDGLQGASGSKELSVSGDDDDPQQFQMLLDIACRTAVVQVEPMPKEYMARMVQGEQPTEESDVFARDTKTPASELEVRDDVSASDTADGLAEQHQRANLQMERRIRTSHLSQKVQGLSAATTREQNQKDKLAALERERTELRTVLLAAHENNERAKKAARPNVQADLRRARADLEQCKQVAIERKLADQDSEAALRSAQAEVEAIEEVMGDSDDDDMRKMLHSQRASKEQAVKVRQWAQDQLETAERLLTERQANLAVVETAAQAEHSAAMVDTADLHEKLRAVEKKLKMVQLQSSIASTKVKELEEEIERGRQEIRSLCVLIGELPSPLDLAEEPTVAAAESAKTSSQPAVAAPAISPMTQFGAKAAASAEPVRGGAAASAEPVRGGAAASAEPVRGGAAASAEPVRGGAAASTEPVRGGAAASAEPVRGGAAASAEPVRGGAAASAEPGEGAAAATPRRGRGAAAATPRRGRGAAAATPRHSRAASPERSEAHSPDPSSRGSTASSPQPGETLAQKDKRKRVSPSRGLGAAKRATTAGEATAKRRRVASDDPKEQGGKCLAIEWDAFSEEPPFAIGYPFITDHDERSVSEALAQKRATADERGKFCKDLMAGVNCRMMPKRHVQLLALLCYNYLERVKIESEQLATAVNTPKVHYLRIDKVYIVREYLKYLKKNAYLRCPFFFEDFKTMKLFINGTRITELYPKLKDSTMGKMLLAIDAIIFFQDDKKTRIEYNSLSAAAMEHPELLFNRIPEDRLQTLGPDARALLRHVMIAGEEHPAPMDLVVEAAERELRQFGDLAIDPCRELCQAIERHMEAASDGVPIGALGEATAAADAAERTESLRSAKRDRRQKPPATSLKSPITISSSDSEAAETPTASRAAATSRRVVNAVEEQDESWVGLPQFVPEPPAQTVERLRSDIPLCVAAIYDDKCEHARPATRDDPAALDLYVRRSGYTEGIAVGTSAREVMAKIESQVRAMTNGRVKKVNACYCRVNEQSMANALEDSACPQELALEPCQVFGLFRDGTAVAVILQRAGHSCAVEYACIMLVVRGVLSQDATRAALRSLPQLYHQVAPSTPQWMKDDEGSVCRCQGEADEPNSLGLIGASRTLGCVHAIDVTTGRAMCSQSGGRIDQFVEGTNEQTKRAIWASVNGLAGTCEHLLRDGAPVAFKNQSLLSMEAPDCRIGYDHHRSPFSTVNVTYDAVMHIHRSLSESPIGITTRLCLVDASMNGVADESNRGVSEQRLVLPFLQVVARGELYEKVGIAVPIVDGAVVLAAFGIFDNGTMASPTRVDGGITTALIDFTLDRSLSLPNHGMGVEHEGNSKQYEEINDVD